jgi:hypothetical protein
MALNTMLSQEVYLMVYDRLLNNIIRTTMQHIRGSQLSWIAHKKTYAWLLNSVNSEFSKQK